jgi:hypothetical protein
MTNSLNLYLQRYLTFLNLTTAISVQLHQFCLVLWILARESSPALPKRNATKHKCNPNLQIRNHLKEEHDINSSDFRSRPVTWNVSFEYWKWTWCSFDGLIVTSPLSMWVCMYPCPVFLRAAAAARQEASFLFRVSAGYNSCCWGYTK